jgi:hypothetical protein
MGQGTTPIAGIEDINGQYLIGVLHRVGEGFIVVQAKIAAEPDYGKAFRHMAGYFSTGFNGKR